MIGNKTALTLTALLAASLSSGACNYDETVGEKLGVAGDAGAGSAATPKPLAWSNVYGGSGYDRAMGVAFTPTGDVVAVGHFDGSLDLDGQRLEGDAYMAGFVARFAGDDGSRIWSHEMTASARVGYAGTPTVEASAVAVDSESNVYVSGTLGGLARFDGVEVSSTDAGGFLAKYGANGDIDWVRTAQLDGLASVSQGVTVGEDGEVTISGWTLEGTLPTQGYIARYGNDGTLLWARRLLSPGNSNTVSSVASAADGDVVASGSFEGTLVVDGQILESVASAPWQSAFVMRFSPEGELRWSYVFGGTRTTTGVSVAVDGDDNIYVAGDIAGTITHGGRTEALSERDKSAFLLALDGGGGRLRWWSAHPTLGGAHGVALSGDEVVTCGFAQRGDLGGGPIPAEDELFVARYDRADGRYVASETLPGGNGPGSDIAFEVATSPAGNIAVAAGVTAAPGEPLDGTGRSVDGIADETNAGILLFAPEDNE